MKISQNKNSTPEKDDPKVLVEALRRHPRDRRADFVASLDPRLAGEVLWQADRVSRADVIFRMDNRALATIAEAVPPDWAARFISLLPPKGRKRVLAEISAEKASPIKTLLSYKPDSAGARMSPEVVTFEKDLNVKQTIEKIRETMSLKKVFHCYVVDSKGKLVGVVPLRKLLMAEGETKLEEIMIADVVSVPVEMDQEEVARVATQNMIFALPVVEKSGVLAGVITLDRVLRVIQEEATEDIYKMAGTDKKEITSQSVFTVARIRAPWLFASWMGGLAAALIIGFFEEAIARVAALAAFLPIVLGMGGNIGTQSSTVVVRGLAMGYINVKAVSRTVLREMGIGVLLGVAYGILLGLFAMFRFRGHIPPYGLDLGFTVGLAIFCSMAIAATMGAFVPLLLKKINVDPAIATGPFVTTSIDILGIIAYFVVAIFFLSEHLA